MIRAFVRDLLICIALALIFTFMGVYDSDAMAWPARAVFWTVLMCLGGLLVFGAEPIVYGRLLKNHHPAVQILAIAAFISVPITIFLAGLNTQFRFNYSLANWVLQFVSVCIISLIIVAGRFGISSVIGGHPGHTIGEPTKSFMDRLPVKFRSGQLLAISSEGHYLRVHTDQGSPLILMRISDAVKELSGADGLQVHRSWWVARDGIEDIRRTNQRRVLVLKNGETAPVSRSYLAALKAANLDR